MSKKPVDNTPVDEDIQDAVQQLNPTEETANTTPEGEVITASAWNTVMFPMPATTNRLILAHWAAKNLIWGTWEAGRKAVQLAKRKPWITTGVFLGAIAFCSVCEYTTALLIGGFMIVAVKKEK